MQKELTIPADPKSSQLLSQINPSKPSGAALSKLFGQIDWVGENGEVRKTWRIECESVTIGSNEGCSIQIPSLGLEAIHGAITFGRNHILVQAIEGAIEISGRPIREWLIDQPSTVFFGAARVRIIPAAFITTQLASHRLTPGDVGDQVARLQVLANSTEDGLSASDEGSEIETDAPSVIEPASTDHPDVSQALLNTTQVATEIQAVFEPLRDSLEAIRSSFVEGLKDLSTSLSERYEQRFQDTSVVIDSRFERLESLLLLSNQAYSRRESPEQSTSNAPEIDSARYEDQVIPDAIQHHVNYLPTEPEQASQYSEAPESSNFLEQLAPQPNASTTADDYYRSENFESTTFNDFYQPEAIALKNETILEQELELVSEHESNANSSYGLNTETDHGYQHSGDSYHDSRFENLSPPEVPSITTIDEEDEDDRDNVAPSFPSPSNHQINPELPAWFTTSDAESYEDDDQAYLPEHPANPQSFAAYAENNPIDQSSEPYGSEILEELNYPNSSQLAPELVADFESNDENRDSTSSLYVDSQSPEQDEAFGESTYSEESATTEIEYETDSARNREFSEAPESEAPEEEEEEESIEVYMQRLLHRAKGGTESTAPSGPNSAGPKMEKPIGQKPFPHPSDPTESTKPAHSRSTTNDLEIKSTEDVEVYSEALKAHVGSPATIRHATRVSVEDQQQSLTALRELANHTARKAITLNTHKRMLSDFYGKLIIAASGFLGGTVVFAVNGLTPNVALAGMICGYAVFLLWGYDAWCHSRRLSATKKEDEVEDE